MTRRGFVGASTSTLLAQSAANPRLPNIVFLLSDDHTAADLGCYGNRVVTTPNFDRLAAQGTRFTRCFVASAQCSPNRSAIFTGCTPHTTSTSRLHTPMPDWEPSFLEPLKAKGYFTGGFRKVHQGNAFNKRFDFYSASDQTPFEEFFDKAPKDRPFFLHVGFSDPHRPYKPGAFAPAHDPAKVAVPPFLPDLPEVRQDLAHYHDAIARLDQQAGSLLSLLDKRGLADNTLVIFTGDNGMPFPRAKGTNYDPGLNVPLLIRWPGRVKAGEVSSQLVSHLDFAPTLLEAAGLKQTAKMQGQPIFGATKREAVYSERNWHDNFDPIRSVRTDRYKLIFNAAPHFGYRPAWDLEDSPTWAAILKAKRRGTLEPQHRGMVAPTRPYLELYDLEKDPNEFQNVADAPEYRAIRKELEAKLSAWMEATLDFLPPGQPAPGTPAGRTWPGSL